MYLPVFYYPIQEDDRATGFLIPTYGSSTLKGQMLSNAFFWAIGRSHDATIYHDWMSKAGQQLGGEYRYVLGPGSQGDSRFSWLDENRVTDQFRRTSAGRHAQLFDQRQHDAAPARYVLAARQRRLLLEHRHAADLSAGHRPRHQPQSPLRLVRDRAPSAAIRSAPPPIGPTISTRRRRSRPTGACRASTSAGRSGRSPDRRSISASRANTSRCSAARASTT